MRIFLLISLIFSVSLNAFAQQFNLLYDYDNYANDGGSIVKSPSGYLTMGGGIDLSLSRYTILVARHDNSGMLSWDLSLSDDNNSFTQSDKNFAIAFEPTNNHYFVAGNFENSESSIIYPCLIKLTEFGDITDTVFFQNIDSENVFGFRLITTNDFLYYLCQSGELMLSFLVKCDLHGNYLSHTTSTIGVQSDPKFITDVGDGLVIGGRYLPSGASNNSIQYVRKFDYDGNELWTNQYNNDGLSSYGAVNAVPLDNGNVLFAATATSGVELQELYRPMIGEIEDSTGDTLWTKRYFSPDSIYRLHNFKRLSSGEYIGVGETRQPLDFPGNPFVTTSFIMKLDSEFNLLWKRIYVPEGFAGIEFPDPTCHLNDFVENEDGGITALGMAFTYTGTGLQSGYIQDSWLMRVDREGCLVSGCAVDITEHQNDKHLFVYPNPASDVLNIQFPHLDKWQVSIYNMQGALVKEEQPNQLLQYSMDVKEWPSGVYTVLCKDTNGKMFAEKVVKP